MCLLALIESSPSRSFAIVNKERAEKIKLLFEQVLKLNSGNKHVKIFQMKADVLIADSS